MNDYYQTINIYQYSRVKIVSKYFNLTLIITEIESFSYFYWNSFWCQNQN